MFLTTWSASPNSFHASIVYPFTKGGKSLVTTALNNDRAVVTINENTIVISSISSQYYGLNIYVR